MRWVHDVRRKQSLRRLRFFGWMTVALVIEIAAMLLWWLVARLFFGVVEMPWVFMMGVTAIGTAISLVFAKVVAPLPFKGRAPEEAAAEAFFKGQDVRSDDHQFEKDLRP